MRLTQYFVLASIATAVISIIVFDAAAQIMMDLNCPGPGCPANEESVSPGHEGSDVDDRPLPSFCCTVVGRLGPLTNPGIREGEVCSVPTVYGPVGGVACY